MGYQGWDEILMITLISKQKTPTPNISAPSVHARSTCRLQIEIFDEWGYIKGDIKSYIILVDYI